MSSLFTMFDPTSSWNLYMALLSTLVIYCILPASFYAVSSTHITGFKKMSFLLHSEIKTILTTSMMPGSSWFLVMLFWCIFLNNFPSLAPHIPTATQFLSFTLKLALPIWAGHMIYAWVKQPNFMFAHLVPKGTPMALWSFMVLIELISNTIRPLTLSVRLMANITGGHAILGVLSFFASPKSSASMVTVTVLSILVIFVMLEIAVALIQAYVFTLLSTLYLKEVQTKDLTYN